MEFLRSLSARISPSQEVFHKPNLSKALLAAQAAMPDAVKYATNPHYHSRYAKFESVRDAVRPALEANGLVVNQTFEPSVPVDAGVIIITNMMHTSGEMMSSKLFLPAAKKDAQGFCACITYGRRYALQAICGIGADDDDDGNGASGKPPAPRTNPPAPNAPPPAAKPPGTNAAQQSAAPTNTAAAAGRKELGDAIMAGVGGSKDAAAAILNAIIPGKVSPSQLSDLELNICKLVITAAVSIDSPEGMRSIKQLLRESIKASVPVENWTPAHLDAAWKALRPGTGPAPGHSAANLQPDDCPF